MIHWLKRLIKLPIHGWRLLIAPMLPPACRFYPSCSSYALQALDQHRLPRALWLIVRRIARCNPFHAGGYDPVPEPPRSTHPHPRQPKA